MKKYLKLLKKNKLLKFLNYHEFTVKNKKFKKFLGRELRQIIRKNKLIESRQKLGQDHFK